MFVLSCVSFCRLLSVTRPIRAAVTLNMVCVHSGRMIRQQTLNGCRLQVVPGPLELDLWVITQQGVALVTAILVHITT